MREGLLKLHLGCFDQVFPGWINTDITSHIFISRIPGLPFLLFKFKLFSKEYYDKHKKGVFREIRYLDVTKKFPYSSDTIDYVYCSHLLEHLYFTQALFCVSEVYRVLKPSGIFRVSVPDLNKIVACYDPLNPEAFLEVIFESKKKRYKNKHHWHYNKKTLFELLINAGFSKVYRCKFREGRCPDLIMLDNRPESLFVEARK